MLALHKAGLYDGIGLFSPADDAKKKFPKPPKVKKAKSVKDIPIPVDRQWLVSPSDLDLLTRVRSGSSPQDKRLVDPPLQPEGPPKDKPTLPEYCKAIHDYGSIIPDGLSFKAGDVIQILRRDPTGWWDAYFGETRGWIPSNYVVELSHEAASAELALESPQTAISELSIRTPHSDSEIGLPGHRPGAEEIKTHEDWFISARPGYESEPEIASNKSFQNSKLKKSPSLDSSSSGTCTIDHPYGRNHYSDRTLATLKENFGSTTTLKLPVSEPGGPVDNLLFEPPGDCNNPAAPLPWYLQSEVNSDSIVFDGGGAVKSGTLPALVEQLTLHERIADRKYIQTFLITFKTFTTADELIEVLVARFKLPPPSGLTHIERDEWSSVKQRVIQTRVLNVFRIMIQDQDILEPEDQRIIEKIKSFIQSRDASFLAAAKILADIIERRVGKVVPKDVGNVDLPSPTLLLGSMKKLSFVDIDPPELARHLTMLENRLYKRIRPQECLRRVRGRKRAPIMDSISVVIQTSNKLADFVVELILSKPDVFKRGKVIRHFIGVATRCRHLKNLSSMVAIVSGLNTPYIRRLKQTWEQVGERALKDLDICEEIMNSTKNFTNYRKLMNSTSPPCVPFIGVFLSDLQFIEDGNPDTYPNGQINFSKRQKLAEVVDDIKRWQTQAYVFKEDPFIMSFIEDSLSQGGESGPGSSDRFWQLSLETEPRGQGDHESPISPKDAAFSVSSSWFLFLNSEDVGSSMR